MHLVEGYAFVHVDANTTRVQGLTRAYLLRCEVPGLIESLVESLQDPERLDELVRKSPKPEEVLALIDRLKALGLVRDEATPGPLSPEDHRRHRDQMAFFRHFLPNPADPTSPRPREQPASAEELQARLKQARVLVYGLGRFGARIVRGLARAGVGTVVGIDGGPVTLDDIASEAGYRSGDLGEPRFGAAQRMLCDLCPGLVFSGEAAPSPPRLEELLGESAFAVLCPDDYDPGTFEVFNSLCLTTRTPWTSLRLLGNRVEVGPTVFPFETPCYACFSEQRLQSAAEPEAYRALEERRREAAVRFGRPAALPGPEMVVLEIARALAGGLVIASYGRVIGFDLSSFESRAEEILRRPRCGSCSGSSERAKPNPGWRKDQPEPMTAPSHPPRPSTGLAQISAGERLSELYHENSKHGRHDWAFLQKMYVMARRSPPGTGSPRRYPDAPWLELPPAAQWQGPPLGQVVSSRRSAKSFSGEPLSLLALSRLLHLGSGITSQPASQGPGASSLRAYPSAGALYPVDLLVAIPKGGEVEPGFYRYVPELHGLEHFQASDLVPKLARSTYFEPLILGAGATLALILDAPKARYKYGERGYRYALLEAGHMAQNLLLAAVALGLQGIPIGGYLDREVDELLAIDGVDATCVYLISVGGTA